MEQQTVDLFFALGQATEGLRVTCLLDELVHLALVFLHGPYHRCQQVLPIKRLDQKVNSALLHGGNALLERALRADVDKGNHSASLNHGFVQVHAAHTRHAHIADHDGRSHLHIGLQEFLWGREGINRVSGKAQQSLHALTHGVIIFYKKNKLRHAGTAFNQTIVSVAHPLLNPSIEGLRPSGWRR